MSISLVTPIPGPKSIALMEARNAHVARGPFHSTPLFVERARGAHVWDVDGNRMLDFASGIGVVNVGHTAPEVVRAIAEQAERNIHSSINVLAYEGYVKLAEKINAAIPGDFPKKSFLCNSGAEAVENAVKIARAFTKRQAVVCFDHAYHGRTYMAMTLTAKVHNYKQGFAPFNPEVYRAPLPYPYRCPAGGGDGCGDTCTGCFTQFTQLVHSQIGAENVAAVIVEPVLGEGGFLPVPPAYLRALRRFCTEHGILLIFDEIQTGFGRTGKMFACEHSGVVPDLMTLAKGLGGGMPIAAVAGRADVMDAPPVGGIGGTYCGNPVACAAALAVFDLFEADKGKLLRDAEKLGGIIQATFARWRESYSIIGDVRGLGPMQALEFVKDRQSKAPDKENTARIAKFCYEHGVITITAGTFGNVLRLLVPLIISEADLHEGLAVIEAGIQSVCPS